MSFITYRKPTKNPHELARHSAVTLPSLSACPTLIAAAGNRAQLRFLEFFASNIRNPHTRRAYIRAVTEFLDWCAAVARVPSIIEVEPLHVAATP